MFQYARRRSAPFSVRGRRHNFFDGRVTRRYRYPKVNPRLYQSQWRMQRYPASFQQPSEDEPDSEQGSSIDYVALEGPSMEVEERTDQSTSLGYQTFSPATSPERVQYHPQPSTSTPVAEAQEDTTESLASNIVNRIADMLFGQNHEDGVVLQERGDMSLYYQDICAFFCCNQYTDAVIDYYLQLIVDRNIRFGTGAVLLSLDAATTRKVIAGSLPPPSDSREADFLMLPVKEDDTSQLWSFVLVDVRSRKIINFNPTQQEDSYCEAIKTVFDEFRPGPEFVIEEEVISGEYRDPGLSGLYVCNFADCITSDLIATFRVQRLNFFRIQFLYEILQNVVQVPEHKPICLEKMAFFIRRFIGERLKPFEGTRRGSLTIRQSSLITLRGDDWLDDAVIDLYFQLLKNYARERRGSVSNIAVISAVYSGCLKGNLDEKFLVDDTFELVDNDPSMIFFPVNAGAHWILLVIVKADKAIYYFDSLWMTNRLTTPPSYVQEMPTYISKLTGYSTALMRRLPVQRNTYDCGVYVCQYARYILEGLKLDENTFSDYDMPRLRATIRNELVIDMLTDLPKPRPTIPGHSAA